MKPQFTDIAGIHSIKIDNTLERAAGFGGTVEDGGLRDRRFECEY